VNKEPLHEGARFKTDVYNSVIIVLKIEPAETIMQKLAAIDLEQFFVESDKRSVQTNSLTFSLLIC